MTKFGGKLRQALARHKERQKRRKAALKGWRTRRARKDAAAAARASRRWLRAHQREYFASCKALGLTP